MKHYRKWLIALCGLFVPSVFAAGINWSLPFGGNHQTSSGAALPAGTRFQLGLFEDGFVPTSANTALWKSHWRGRAEVSYMPEFQGFGGFMNVEENPAPFTAGTPLYIWGFRQLSNGTSEWVLAKHATWVMPAVDPLAFPMEVDMTGGDFILGSVDIGTGSITTASVATTEAPAFLWQDWLSEYFYLVERQDALVSGASADADGDGLPNGLEYAMGTDPRQADHLGASGDLQVQSAGASSVKVSFPGSPTVTGYLQIETSVDLVGWESVSTGLTYDPEEQRWWFTQPLESRRFWRLRIP